MVRRRHFCESSRGKWVGDWSTYSENSAGKELVVEEQKGRP